MSLWIPPALLTFHSFPSLVPPHLILSFDTNSRKDHINKIHGRVCRSLTPHIYSPAPIFLHFLNIHIHSYAQSSIQSLKNLLGLWDFTFLNEYCTLCSPNQFPILVIRDVVMLWMRKGPIVFWVTDSTSMVTSFFLVEMPTCWTPSLHYIKYVQYHSHSTCLYIHHFRSFGSLFITKWCLDDDYATCRKSSETSSVSNHSLLMPSVPLFKVRNTVNTV